MMLKQVINFGADNYQHIHVDNVSVGSQNPKEIEKRERKINNIFNCKTCFNYSL